jgi:peptidoglycan/xylan/chitin deacetylase (PgdA/CDA1 family)
MNGPAQKAGGAAAAERSDGGLAGAAYGVGPLEVAITVDDLPAHGPAYPGLDRLALAEQFLAAFAAHRVPSVYGFVNGQRVDEDPATELVLKRWLAAGHALGNHSWSHPSLQTTPLPQYLADIERGEAVLEKLGALGNWRPFRHPFLLEGDTHEQREAVREFLRDRGYTSAQVSIEADDWAYNTAYARSAELGRADAMQALVADLVLRHVAELTRVRALTHALMGRDIAHVLLLHLGCASAAAIEPLLVAYERAGVRWIGLRAALADPFYAIETAPLPHGASAPYRLATERALEAPLAPRDDVHARLLALCSAG